MGMMDYDGPPPDPLLKEGDVRGILLRLASLAASPSRFAKGEGVVIVAVSIRGFVGGLSSTWRTPCVRLGLLGSKSLVFARGTLW